MTSKQEAEDWRKKRDLQAIGYAIKPAAIRLHNRDETAEHLTIKALLARELHRKGRRWDTEVRCDTGRVDVIDLGPIGGRPVIYEVETDCTAQQRRAKVDQYQHPPIRDVVVIDPTDAPERIPDIPRWLSDHIIG